MRKLFIFLVFLLTVTAAISCLHRPPEKVRVNLNRSETGIATIPDSKIDALASFIAGMQYNKNLCFSRLDSAIGWRTYSTEYDSLFAYASRLRINSMKSWADDELIRDTTVTTLFYPFSGPDFLTADIFYPSVRQYILVGLEPIGELPDLCNMKPDSAKEYMNSVSAALNDLLIRSYFITSKMNSDLRKTRINGVISMLSVFIERMGHHIVSMRNIGIDSTGNYRIIDSLQNRNLPIQGVRMDFTTGASGRLQSVTYFRADLSNKGLKNNPGFRKYITRLPLSCTFLKSAAFLMYSHNFKLIRDLIFDRSSTILQDDSGIAFRDFNRSRWKIRLYGKFSKPKNELSFYRESSLVEAFRHSEARPLPFSLGYNWGTDHTCMIYAIKR